MSGAYVIRILGPALGAEPAVEGAFLRAFDPDARGGRGHVEATRDPLQAMRFASQAAAFECWRRQSKRLPVRPDGAPNRPLTAYWIEILALPS